MLRAAMFIDDNKRSRLTPYYHFGASNDNKQPKSGCDEREVDKTAPDPEGGGSNVPGVPFHHWCAAIAPATSIGHKGEVAGAKVLAGTILDLLQNPELIQRARECFEEENKGVKYEPLLPPDTRPPLDLNKQMMDGYREEMKKRYVNKKVKFVWRPLSS